MSDTPLTDKVRWVMAETPHHKLYAVWAEDCQKIERKLNAALKRIEKMKRKAKK